MFTRDKHSSPFGQTRNLNDEKKVLNFDINTCKMVNGNGNGKW
jgi:hypothetical protein